MDILYILSLK